MSHDVKLPAEYPKVGAGSILWLIPFPRYFRASGGQEITSLPSSVSFGNISGCSFRKRSASYTIPRSSSYVKPDILSSLIHADQTKISPSLSAASWMSSGLGGNCYESR